MSFLEWFELLSYAVTVFGLPLAIIVFLYEQRKERVDAQEELNSRLSDEYNDFLKLVLDNADLQLLRRTGMQEESLTGEQKERRLALFGILVSLFERAYITGYSRRMDKQTLRLWLTWDDFIHEWCSREDFRNQLPQLLEGEDEDFKRYILAVSEEVKSRNHPAQQ